MHAGIRKTVFLGGISEINLELDPRYIAEFYFLRLVLFFKLKFYLWEGNFWDF